MAFGLPNLAHGKRALRRTLSGAKQVASSMATSVPKGHFVVYVGEDQKKRYVVPLWYLNESAFQELLSLAKEEFGYDHPMGGLTIPCSQDAFVDVTSQFRVDSNSV